LTSLGWKMRAFSAWIGLVPRWTKISRDTGHTDEDISGDRTDMN